MSEWVIESPAATATPMSPGVLGPALTLARRELVRFFRQRNRVVGALLQPIIFFVFFGAALNNSFKPPTGAEGMSYQEYFFPGTIVMIVMFTAIFSTISIIEDRREGFLQSVLVSPAPRLGMVLGKVFGGSALAMIQALLFMCAGFFLKIKLDAVMIAQAAGILALISFALCGLGFIIAWRMDSTQGFHAIMSVFLLPMLMLSGAFFPDAGLPLWLSWIVKLNPLTYGVAALRHVLYDKPLPFLPDFKLSLALTAAFAAVTVIGSVLISGTRTTGDLQ
ncbi:MAG TPA: ABC transporter permease [Planctomycetota bacterium]|nr:ABC transporter permease [Planctomycetota bacterium]